MNFGSISSLYILSKTSEKSWNENLSFDLKSFSQEGTGLTGAHHRSDRWYPWSHTIFFWDLSGCKVSYKTPEEVFRGVYSKLEWRIRTSKARSVLPIWFLCWIYQNHRYYRARVGKTAKGSLARPRAVTGLTGGARLQPVGQQWKESTLLPRFLLSPPLFTSFNPSKPWRPSSLPSSTSLKTHRDLKIQLRESLKIGSKRISQGPSSLPPSSSLDSIQVLLSKGIQIFVFPDRFTPCKDLNFFWYIISWEPL
jgi:hypothetical protein